MLCLRVCHSKILTCKSLSQSLFFRDLANNTIFTEIWSQKCLGRAYFWFLVVRKLSSLEVSLLYGGVRNEQQSCMSRHHLGCLSYICVYFNRLMCFVVQTCHIRLSQGKKISLDDTQLQWWWNHKMQKVGRKSCQLNQTFQFTDIYDLLHFFNTRLKK